MAGRRNIATTGVAERSSTTNEPNLTRSSRSSSKYSANNFNPKLIFSQIVALQCFHYLVLGIIFQFDHLFFNTSVTIDRIFTDNYLTVWTWIGWIDSSAILLSYLFG